MRAISAELLAKIQKLNQTMYENADPFMRAVIEKTEQVVNTRTLRQATRLGSIDLALKLDNPEAVQLWIISEANRQIFVDVYDFPDPDWGTPNRTFNVACQDSEATPLDVAITFNGGLPWLFWVERLSTHNKIYALQWDGAGVQPVASELLSVAR